MNAIDLTGQRAIISGGAQGIGLATAQRFIASGAQVQLMDIDLEHARQSAATLGDAAGAVEANVADWASVQAATKAAEAAMGGIDIAVFSAGITGPNVPLAEYPVADWARVIDIDLNGIFHCCRAVVPVMQAQGYGRIVNIASVAGKEGNPSASAYSAAKAGVIALTKSLGKELAAEDIAVNCITPAAAKTAIFDQMTPEFIAYMKSKIPRGRFVEVDEIASMIAWLVSRENSFTTGAVFDLSGGRATY